LEGHSEVQGLAGVPGLGLGWSQFFTIFTYLPFE
jgi:hypothetical protein